MDKGDLMAIALGITLLLSIVGLFLLARWLAYRRLGSALRNRKATPREITQTAIFLAAVLVPLILIPVFPRLGILQAINTNGKCFVLLVVVAVLVSILITRLIFRRRNGKSLEL
jgi:TRAP-type C4-dicarboxylate transport system permease large subunit